MQEKQKKYHIKTWGCQMNVYDSQRISEILQSLGYVLSEDATESDLVILNTCHVREKATEKVYSDIGRLNILKQRRQKVGQSLIIGVSGCVAQAEGEEIIRRAPCVDLVFGPQTWHRLSSMIKKIEEENAKVCDTDFPVEEKFDSIQNTAFDKSRINNGSAFIAVQEGCDKFCTYCVVPYTRGAEYSRPTWQVLEEINRLVKEGAKEITLLGQNVNAYHGMSHDNSEWSLGKLIEKISSIEGLQRIRYLTSYPAEVDDTLISAHKNLPKLMPFLHLPIQAGSNRILRSMNRNHTKEQYLDLIAKLKEARSDLAFSSDFIVGFPGETIEDFEETLDIVNRVGFIQSFSFAYSPRLGTPSIDYENQVPLEEKERRLYILQDLLKQKQREFNEKTVGQIMDVLFERQGKFAGQLVGKSPYMQAVAVDNAPTDALGKIYKVKITKNYNTSLIGEIVE
ncbi:MAG: tRNA (N6-isopentenyl adenosine(37)-C2)-methylthiotransferase MiaB [Alphaproteobacteria bacterium]|jgi:tRNA-2-methylthio-N6-dimethylallyladenosine synthase|nr:tRNA (N6-isopentenyl adenosine(37)-C2)-methylthiotransferase MiaB [Alphaproteobacteria bacterium]